MSIVQSSCLWGAVIGAYARCEVEASSDLLEEHLCLAEGAHMQVAKLTPMHVSHRM